MPDSKTPNPVPNAPGPASLARCAAIPTSTWSDALDALGIEGLVEGVPQRSGTGRFAAWATTARIAIAPRDTYDKGVLGVGRIIDAVPAGGALMVDMGGAPVSTFGGLAARAAARKAAAAIVIDGACRDLDEVMETGLWLASRHVTPRTGKTRGRLETVGEAITVGGVRVEAGDLVVGDATGLVVIPRGRVAEVLAIAETRLATDLAVEEGLRAGLTFAEAAAKASYL